MKLTLRILAERGAVVRLSQLAEEARAIHEMFPGLQTTESGAPIVTGKRGRKPLSDARRREISRRMRAYWAKRRAAKQGR